MAAAASPNKGPAAEMLSAPTSQPQWSRKWSWGHALEMRAPLMPFLLFREGRKDQSSASWTRLKNRRPTLGSRSALRRARVYRCSRGVQQGEGGSSEEALLLLGAASCPVRPCHPLPAQRWAEAGHTAMECGYRCWLADGSTAGGGWDRTCL